VVDSGSRDWPLFCRKIGARAGSPKDQVLRPVCSLLDLGEVFAASRCVPVVSRRVNSIPV